MPPGHTSLYRSLRGHDSDLGKIPSLRKIQFRPDQGPAAQDQDPGPAQDQGPVPAPAHDQDKTKALFQHKIKTKDLLLAFQGAGLFQNRCGHYPRPRPTNSVSNWQTLPPPTRVLSASLSKRFARKAGLLANQFCNDPSLDNLILLLGLPSVAIAPATTRYRARDVANRIGLYPDVPVT